MKEEFLHYLWKSNRFDPMGLVSTEEETVEIINYGLHNTHAGPDFLNAELEIAGIRWNGNVEMHIKSSEWYQHAHDIDPAYDNVILHVVLDDNRPVKRRTGKLLPTLVLKDRVPAGLIRNYQRLMREKNWIPCAPSFRSIKEIIVHACIDHQMVKRLERKTSVLEATLVAKKWDWETCFYLFLAKNFGLKVNAMPFFMLANSFPLVVLMRHRDRLLELEALLFGQAGMLDENFEDEYPNRLKEIYLGLKNKYQLSAIPISSWKYLRLRPANFPSIRIAQFARLIHQSDHLFSKILAIKNTREILNMFELEISNYWKTHYQFDKLSKPSNKKLGKNTIQLFIINTIVPFLFLYGKRKNDEVYKRRAIKLLEELPAEKNSIISGWQKLGLDVPNAQISQALLELKTEACDKKQCLNCQIGHSILKKESGLKTIRLG